MQVRSIAYSLLLSGAAAACAATPRSTTVDPGPTKIAAEDPAALAAPEPVPLTLKLASDVWSPYTDEDGKPRLALDLVHEALRRAGITATTSLTQPGALTPILENQEFDGSAALWKSPDREQYLLFSEPYLQNRLVLLGRAGSNVSAQSLADLKDKKLGLVTGYSYGPALETARGVQLVYGKSEPDNLEMLLNGDLDYILVEELLVYHLFQKGGAKASSLLVAGTKSLLSRGLHLGLQRDLPGAKEILRRFDEQIHQLLLDGTYNRVLSVSWVATDTNRDGKNELILAGNAAGAAPPERHYRLFGDDTQTAPHFVIEGQVYQDWQNVPERYKVPQKEGLDSFEPAMNVVLFKF